MQDKMVYVQNKNGTALMPCKPAKARHLLRDKKAVVIQLCPFTIRLNWNCENNRQEVIVGLDTGAVKVGCSAISGDRVLYASETKLRTSVRRKMQRRAIHRRNRRNKLRYRKPRFNNRTRPKGWLPPSLKSKAESTIKIVKQLSKVLPINKVIVEIAKFDTQKLQNPNIKGREYHQGNLAGYDNVRAYVFERDRYTCRICKKKFDVLQTHHIIERKDGGSNRPDNMVTLHKKCHKDYHKGLIKHKFRKPKEYKIETQVTVLKDYIVNELRKDFEVEVTFGYITKKNRLRLNLPKSHLFDAVAICNPSKINKINKYYERVCIPRGRYSLSMGVRSSRILPKGKLFGFSRYDKVLVNQEIGFIKGTRTSGFFDVCDIGGKSISHSIKYPHLQKLYSKNVMEVSKTP